MTTTDKRKRSLYFPDTILREMQSEAKRQERSLSWIVQYAWRIARAELMRLPSVGSGAGYRGEEYDGDDADEGHGSSNHEHGAPHHGHDFGDENFSHHGR